MSSLLRHVYSKTGNSSSTCFSLNARACAPFRYTLLLWRTSLAHQNGCYKRACAFTWTVTNPKLPNFPKLQTEENLFIESKVKKLYITRGFNCRSHRIKVTRLITIAISRQLFTPEKGNKLVTKGVFTWHRGDFRAGASSLRFPLVALHLFTWYHNKISWRRESPRREFTPVVAPGWEFLSGTRFRNDIMKTWKDHPFRCEIDLQVDWNG